MIVDCAEQTCSASHCSLGTIVIFSQVPGRPITRIGGWYLTIYLPFALLEILWS